MSKPVRIQIVRQNGLASMFNVITLANFLSDAGHKVKIVCVEPERETIAGLHDEIEVAYLGAGKGSSFKKLQCRLQGAKRLRAYLKKQSFDLLYVIDSWTLPTLWLTTFGSMRWPGTRLCYHTFDWIEHGLVAETHIRLECRVCHKADLVVNTDRARARLQKTIYGLKANPLWVQNCLSKFITIPTPNKSLRKELTGKINSDQLRIVIYPTVVSNGDSSQRMIWELIQGFIALPETYHLVLFYREGEEYQRCLASCAAAGISERVTFLKPIPFLKLLDYIAVSDIGIIFYDDSQSSGYFMCNADKLSLFAACGVPFVASDQPNLEAVTYRYGLGQCCNPRDSKAVAEAITQVADGSMPLATLKQHVRQVFAEHLNFEIQGQPLLKAISMQGRHN